ncbi:rhodanese-like domain-containing protein [Priestia koreensis]|uniref:Rhodanese sulfurtransferase n=1 Tax=Priestia koreensis TaxID=284581 RepID=A0A0M0L545_9BACI|nr:rhodanese sulfurtransferase [Priestia koreensis]KOO46164.1 rhodanese sulfurtransferase [Priestia koreensis]MCM3004208.1 rhodanese-like domain-containing protein [Priestia koreensis]UNL83424.1 rhodanese-like domain-containing protein [Priestia koreensis]
MTILVIGIAMVLLVIALFYQRYVPVQGVRKVDSVDCEQSGISLVDVRHFNEITKQPCPSAIHIPLAYLERHHSDIPLREVVVIVNDRISRNLSVRRLKKLGFDVRGYMCTCE